VELDHFPLQPATQAITLCLSATRKLSRNGVRGDWKGSSAPRRGAPLSICEGGDSPFLTHLRSSVVIPSKARDLLLALRWKPRSFKFILSLEGSGERRPIASRPLRAMNLLLLSTLRSGGLQTGQRAPRERSERWKPRSFSPGSEPSGSRKKPAAKMGFSPGLLSPLRLFRGSPFLRVALPPHRQGHESRMGRRRI
jgi:hypothetical protein